MLYVVRDKSENNSQVLSFVIQKMTVNLTDILWPKERGSWGEGKDF